MTQRRHFSTLTLLAVLVAALTATAGFAQPKAETKAAATAPAPSPAAETGVLVVAVQPGSPAEKAGIARGDIILEANGTAVNDPEQMRQAVIGRAAGDALSIKLRHGDVEKTVSVTVGTQEGRSWIGVLPFENRGFGMRGNGGPGYGPMFPAEGALVETVTAGSPAEKAGLKKGDLILALDGTTVDERNPLADIVSSKKAGDTVTLLVASWGQEKAREVKVTLEKKPDKDGPFLGVQYMPAPPMLRGPVPGPGMMAGAMVVDVAENGPAAKAGIRTRDLITKVDGAAVTNPQAVVDAVAKHTPGDTIVLTVVRRPEGKQTDITVTLGQNPDDAAKAWLGLSMGGGPGFPGMHGKPRTGPSAAGANAPTL